MENSFNNFESLTDSVIFEDQQPHFAMQTFSPGGEDEDDEEEDDADNSSADDKTKTNESDDDNPPLDEDVVHSPLPTQTGGKPGKK